VLRRTAVRGPAWTAVRAGLHALNIDIVGKRFKFDRCHRLAANRAGRDFVVGDLHGQRALLEQALRAVAFDPRHDRVLSVGDLVDRGPDSIGTLALLEEPWFHAVLGNHELMLLNYLGYYDSRVHSRRAYAAGAGTWLVQALARDARRVERLADRVAALPLSLQVLGPDPCFVMHGDLAPLGARQEALLDKPLLCALQADASARSRQNFVAAQKCAGFELQHEGQAVRLTSAAHDGRALTYAGHSRARTITVHASYVYVDQGVGSPSAVDGLPRRPTVLEHRRFSAWLGGVMAGLDRARRGLQAESGQWLAEAA
jgi:serine/threonine protein phosphatase 1